MAAVNLPKNFKGHYQREEVQLPEITKGSKSSSLRRFYEFL